jgi:hypothetical protein
MSIKTSHRKSTNPKLKISDQTSDPNMPEANQVKPVKKTWSDEEMRHLVVGAPELLGAQEPHQVLAKVQKFIDAVHKDKEAVNDDYALRAGLTEASRMLSLDTKHNLKFSVEKEDVAFAIEMARELEKEYGVKTASEKALVQIAVAAYCRFHKCSSLFYLNYAPSITSPQLPQYISIYAKEMDRAHRQFIAAIQALKQLKSPEIKVQVTAKTAFVAQNQQNVSQVVPQVNPENNEAQ